MIKGLQFRITSKELNEHLVARAGYHRERADSKEAELPQLKETLSKIKNTKPALHISGKSAANYQMDPDSPIEELETDIRNHRNSALSFDFMAQHLFEEDYDLNESDFIRLELLRRY